MKISLFLKLRNNIKVFSMKFLSILIVFLKYTSIFVFIIYFIYLANPTYNQIIVIENNKQNILQEDPKLGIYNIFKIKNNGKKISLVKSLIISYKKKDIIINPVYREPKFKFKEKIYDIEGKIIEENIEENKYLLNNISGNNENFFLIFQMFKKLNKFDMEYNGIRWNLYIYRKNKKFKIKIPIEINEYTKKKIEFLILNEDICFDEDFPIIDLRFSKSKIYLVKN